MDREGLERVWRIRMAEAALQLSLARNFLKEVRLSGDSPEYERAVQAERAAHAEYLRVLRVYDQILEVPRAAGAA